MGWEILKLIFYLIIFAVVIWAAYYSCKKLAVHGTSFGGSKYMRIIDRMTIGKDVAIVMIKIGDKYLLTSQTASGVELIREFSEEEFEEIKANEITVTEIENPLSGILSNVLGNGKFSKGEKKSKSSSKGFDFSKFGRRNDGDGEILGRYDGDISDVGNIDFNEILKRGMNNTDEENSKHSGKSRRNKAKKRTAEEKTEAVDEIFKSIDKRKKSYDLRKEENNET